MALSKTTEEKVLGVVILAIGLVIDISGLLLLVYFHTWMATLIIAGVLGLPGFFITRHGIYCLGTHPCRMCRKPVPNDLDYCPHCGGDPYDVPMMRKDYT